MEVRQPAKRVCLHRLVMVWSEGQTTGILEGRSDRVKEADTQSVAGNPRTARGSEGNDDWNESHGSPANQGKIAKWGRRRESGRKRDESGKGGNEGVSRWQGRRESLARRRAGLLFFTITSKVRRGLQPVEPAGFFPSPLRLTNLSHAGMRTMVRWQRRHRPPVFGILMDSEDVNLV